LRSYEKNKHLKTTWEKYFKKNFRKEQKYNIKQICMETPYKSKVMIEADWHDNKYFDKNKVKFFNHCK
jgi:hypothetical protein